MLAYIYSHVLYLTLLHNTLMVTKDKKHDPEDLVFFFSRFSCEVNMRTGA
jgi:hypothetical protein